MFPDCVWCATAVVCLGNGSHLGFLHYFLMLAIFTYIVVYNIVVLQGASIGVREHVVEVRAILGYVVKNSWRDVDICAGYKELGNVVGTTRMQVCGVIHGSRA